MKHSRLLTQSASKLRQVVLGCNNYSTATPTKWYTEHKTGLSYAHGSSDVPLLHVTMAQALRQATNCHPDQEVYIFRKENVRKTYAEFLKEVERCASGLISMGVERGDRVGIWSPNHYEWVLTQFAAAMAGAILVNVNPAYQAGELAYCLKKVGIKMLILPESYGPQEFYSILTEVCPSMLSAKPGMPIHESKFPELEHIVTFNTGGRRLPGAWDYHTDLMTAGGSIAMAELGAIEPKIRPDDPVNIQFTSGTTGFPKGATLTHHGIVNNAYFIGRRIDFHKKHHIISCGPPLYHCFGCVGGSLATVVHGVTCVFPAPSWQAEPQLKAINDEKCTAIYGTPTMFIDMVNNPNREKYDFSSVETGIMAGAPCPTQLCHDVISKLNCKGFAIAYGSTETSPVSFQSQRDEPAETRVKSIGMIGHHIEAVVVDRDGQTVPLGQPGELWTRGYSTMVGYWEDPAKTAESITPERWYKTGDQAVMDERGCVMIVGRIKDCIIRGGENIYPVEIEELLYKHPKIEHVQIVGVPDERFGEVVCAWIALHKNQNCTEQEIKDYLHGKLAHFKIPRYIQFKHESDFPVTVTGKIQKYQIREIATKELGLDNVKAHYA